MPQVILAAARDNNVTQVDPGLSYQVGLLIIVEDRDLELVVVWGVVNSETNLLVPLQVSEEKAHERWSGLGLKLEAYHLGVWPPRISVVVFLASLPSLAAQ